MGRENSHRAQRGGWRRRCVCSAQLGPCVPGAPRPPLPSSPSPGSGNRAPLTCALCVTAAAGQPGGAGGGLQRHPGRGAGGGRGPGPPQAPREQAADADQRHPGDHGHRAGVHQAPPGHLRGERGGLVAARAVPCGRPAPARPSAHACSWSPAATPACGPCAGRSLTRCWCTPGSVSGRPSSGRDAATSLRDLAASGIQRE